MSCECLLHDVRVVRLHTCIPCRCVAASRACWRSMSGFGQVVAVHAVRFLVLAVVPHHRELDPLTIANSKWVFQAVPGWCGRTAPQKRVSSEDGVNVPTHS